MSRRIVTIHLVPRCTPTTHSVTRLRNIANLRFYAIHPHQASSTKPTSTLPGAPESGTAETQPSNSTPTPTNTTSPPSSQPAHLTGYQPPIPTSTDQISPPPPSTPAATETEDKEPHRPNIYALFGRPFAKVFLGAMFTYQVLYYAWERMRLVEVQEEKMGEMRMLEGEVEGYKKRREGGGV